MKNYQYIFSQPNELISIVKELSIPDAEYVTVKFIACGICGGDYSTYIGRRKYYPISLGHEFVGEIINVGENVFDFHIGQKVISDFNYRCGKCKYCLSGHSHLCIDNNVQLFSNRAYAQYGNIHKEYLIGIPDIPDINRACFIEPLSCVIHAIKSIPNTPSSFILVNGCGSIGTMAVFYLTKILHYKNIYVYDINMDRLKNVIQCFGVHNFMLCCVSPDIIIECSNQEKGITDALTIADPGAVICIISHLYGVDTSFIYENICKKELKAYFPLRNGEKENLLQSIDLITKYWEQEYDILYNSYCNLNYILKNKPKLPYNKQIFDITNAVWDSTCSESP